MGGKGARRDTGFVFLFLMLCVASMAFLWYQRQQTLERTALETGMLADSVSQTLGGMLQGMDYALQVTADEMEHQMQTGPIDAEALARFMQRQQTRFPHIRLLRASDRDGVVIYGNGLPAVPQSLGERDYFRRLYDDPNAGMVIAEPVLGKISQKWLWLTARRYTTPDGRFAGIVYAAVYI